MTLTTAFVATPRRSSAGAWYFNRIRMARAASAALMGLALMAGAGVASAAPPSSAFTLSSPDLQGGSFGNKFSLNGFGCTGGNVSPSLAWQNPPTGTQGYALQVRDLDAPAGHGMWHWAIYNIPGNATSLAQGAGNSASSLPAPAFGGNTDFFDTGVTGGNGNYAGPCPPTGDKAHRYEFTLYAYGVPDLAAAGGVPKSGTAGLYSFLLNKGLGPKLLGKAGFVATYGR